MITVKFNVLLFLIASCTCQSKYCEICTDHILCQYSIPGPGLSCKEYDRSKFLTDNEIYDLVNQINERRNFIALGNSRHLPSAANMNKLVWSEELATFAQRWVDQCDPSLRPDREDRCRDLEHTHVGQNIASITNPSPRFSVKSFIEMWFMQLLDYKGSVTYYDQFQDHTTNYFTQLIWAETEIVGCGRAHFKIRNVTVNRIVCNFSPKGNIHGKPVYRIGYPATQCQNQEMSHEKFKGLCTQSFIYKAKSPVANLPVNSLLKILNLSNDSVQQEIDPIYNNMKQIAPHRNEAESPKHQMMRHIFGNKLQSKGRDYPHQQAHNFWESKINVTRNYKEHFHNRDRDSLIPDRNRFYKYTDQSTKSYQSDDFRKHVKTTDFRDNYGIFNNFKKQCTRNTGTHSRDCENRSKTSINQKVYQCTRGAQTNWQMLQNKNIPVTNIIPNDYCPCSIPTYTTYPTTNSQRMYTLSCKFVNANGLTIRCPNLLRTLKDNTHNRNTALESEISVKDAYLNPEEEYEWLFNKRRKSIPESNRNGNIHSNRNRYKREFDESTSHKPFWQIDSFSYDGNVQTNKLKSLRYTTLHNKRQQKTKRYPSKSFTTESITINFKNTNMKAITEKYLSFDELLHLRKFNLSGNNAKRRMEPEILRNPAEEKATVGGTEVAEENKTEYTTNTPFIRIKHCTRKLTCTWTAAFLTDSNGSVVGNRDQGSRTPPGYVEGCTRTSTCTRDYLNRNKFPTTITSSTNDADDDANNDSDYCERRSLNMRKRNSNKKRSFSKKLQRKVSNPRLVQCACTEELNDDRTLNNNNSRTKRSLSKHKCTQNSLSYGDLYYLILNKIIKVWKNSREHDTRCQCNNATKRLPYLHMLLFFFHMIIFLTNLQCIYVR